MKQAKQKEPKSRVKFSICLKFTILTVFCIVLAIFINYNYSMSNFQNTLHDSTSTSLISVTEARSNYIDEAISKFNSTMTYLDSSENITVFNNNKGERYANEVNVTLKKFMEQNPTHESIGFISAESKTVLASTDESFIGKDYSSESFVNEILETNTPCQSNVFFDEETGEAMISIAVPQHTHVSADQFAGVLFTNIKVSMLSDTISNIKINDSEESYALLTDSNGLYVYHPDTSLIGTPTDNTTILSVLDQLDDETFIDSNSSLDTSTGEYFAYKVSDMNHWVLYLAIPQAIIDAPLVSLRSQTIFMCIIILAILCTTAYIFANTITKPLSKITKLVNKTAKLDLREDTAYHKYKKSNDETGEIARAVLSMRASFRDMMQDISATSTSLSQSANFLQEISSTMDEHATSNSATAEELSAGIVETSSSTTKIGEDIDTMQSHSNEMNLKTRAGVQFSEEILKRASILKDNTINASNKTKEMYLTVKEETNQALEDSKSVSKINDLAKTIMDIAEETSLLSLNASIEAARAGESGRGFSVVASEIGKLANQSANTVSNISVIIEEVHDAVDRMAASLTKSLAFLDESVMNDYSSFIDAGNQYALDATQINETMQTVESSIGELNSRMEQISDSITAINASVDESTVGVGYLTSGHQQIVQLSSKTSNMVESTISYSAQLNHVVEQFSLPPVEES